MRTRCMNIAAVMILSAPAITSAQELAIDGSAAAIREVVSGKTCVGKDTLRFGDSTAGSSGTFERLGRPEGRYAIGYGTILVRRGQDLHGHVTSVSVLGHRLYVSAETYRCASNAKEISTPAKVTN